MPNASCPFTKGTCKSDFGNIIIETDELDAYKHLGLNKGPSFTMRVRHHCAPLKIDAKPDNGYLRYRLGGRANNLTFEIEEDSTTSALSHRGNYVV